MNLESILLAVFITLVFALIAGALASISNQEKIEGVKVHQKQKIKASKRDWVITPVVFILLVLVINKYS